MNELQLARLVHDVANAMSMQGESWVLAADEAERGFGVDMRSRDGEIVNFQSAERGGYVSPRLYIEGIDPLTAYTVGKPITVLIARGPEVIAREIERRLLPGYREELAERRAKEAKVRAEFEARAAAVNAAEKLFGQPSDFGAFDPNHLNEYAYKTEARISLRGEHVRPVGRRESTESEYARVSTTHDGSLLNLTVSNIPVEVVMQMLAVLAEHNDTWPAAGA